MFYPFSYFLLHIPLGNMLYYSGNKEFAVEDREEEHDENQTGGRRTACQPEDHSLL